eukprot:8928011-Alexandrium_andersonii.AAC.1
MSSTLFLRSRTSGSNIDFKSGAIGRHRVRPGTGGIGSARGPDFVEGVIHGSRKWWSGCMTLGAPAKM